MKKTEFERLIANASKEVDEKIGKEFTTCDIKVEFSNEHKEKMEKLFTIEKKQNKINRINIILKYVACFITGVVLVSGLTLYTGVANDSEYIDKIRKIFNNGTTYSSYVNKKYTVDRIGFSYFPDEFKSEKINGSYSGITVTYKSVDEYFTLEVYETASKTLKLSETGEVYKVSFYDAYYNENNSIKSLEWSTKDFDIKISGNIPRNEIIKIAENLRVYR